MRVMWVCNGPVSKVNQILSSHIGDGPSWIEGLLDVYAGRTDFELAYCFPQRSNREQIKIKVGNILFYGFYRASKQIYAYSRDVEISIKKIINEFEPDILHIFGTEYAHSLAAIQAYNNPDKTIISIQGLCHIIAKHYYSGLPHCVVNQYTFRDLIRNDSIRNQAIKFQKRGEFEKIAISNVSHIIGRTDFDKACCMAINPNAEYHFCNEVLRESFYINQWDIDKCEKYSIFFSQCYYPIKGFHLMLEALADIRKIRPETHLFVAGLNITKMNSIKDRLRISSYGKFIRKLIKRYDLEKNVTFLGRLNEYEISERFLRSHVFVSASTIENSPNSVGEALMLGVPTVCSDVGGVKNLIKHNEDGFIYQWDAPYMLAYYIKKIFNDNNLALSLSNAAQHNASLIYNRKVNIQTLIDIYKSIVI